MARIGNLIRDPVELKSRAVQLERLSTMLDRITKKDVDDTAQALRDCAEDIADLLRAELVGCPCRRIDNDNTGASYLIYVAECPHHKWLKAEEERIKAAYATAEAKLKRDARYNIAMAALASLSADDPTSPESYAKQALRIADAMVAELLK